MKKTDVQALSLSHIVQSLKMLVEEKCDESLGYSLHTYQGWPYAVKDGLARALTLGEFTEDLTAFIIKLMSEYKDYAIMYEKMWLHKNAQQVAKSLVNVCGNRLSNAPAALVEAESNEIAFARLPFAIRPTTIDTFKTEAPILAEMVGRMDQPERFAGWLCNCLVGHNRKQALWLWGDPNNYKSTFLEKVIGHLFQASFGAISSAQLDPSYQWLEQQLEGKRLVLCDEATPGIIDSERFKQLTGSGQVYANVKYQGTKTIKLDCHFAFTSNPMPRISRDAAVRHRVLPVRLTGTPRHNLGYQEAIMAMRQEIRWLVCWGASCAANTGPSKAELLQACPSVHWSDALELFDSKYRAAPNSTVSASEVHEYLRAHGLANQKLPSVIKIWNLERGVTQQRTKNNRVYRGLELL